MGNGQIPNFGPGGLRILLVEDHEDTRNSLQTLLGVCGFCVKAVPDAETALDVPRDLYDVAVIDLGLPGKNGLELVQDLRREGPVKAIAMTGHGMPDEIARCMSAGFSHHILKPNVFDELLRALEELSASPPMPVAHVSEIQALRVH